MKKLIIVFIWSLLVGLFSGCHCNMYEKSLIINKVEKGNGQFKFCYAIEAFPVDQILYSNEIFHVGDTIKICR